MTLPPPPSTPRQPASPPPPPPHSRQPVRGPNEPVFVTEPRRSGPVTNQYDHALSRWGLGDAAVAIALFFVVSIAAVGALIAIDGDANAVFEGPLLPLIVVLPQAVQLAFVVWVARAKGRGLRRDMQLRFTAEDVGLAFGLLVASLVLATAVGALLTVALGEAPSSAAADVALEAGESGLDIWIVLFAILGATFIPLAEELVFRGLLWSALEKRGVSPAMALVVTSGLFAIIHLEPIRTPILFVIGLALGYARYRTGRLGAAVLLHVFINSLAMTVTVISLV